MKTLNLLSRLPRRTSAALFLLFVTSLLTTASAAAAASPSELLEQGIYSEETRGDVDAALKLYQQVVTEAKAGQAVAAQAQYRLGVCYYKKKNYGKANEAFEKLLHDYPDEKDLIALANKYLANAMPLMPVPWVDGEDLQADLKLATGFRIGVISYRANSGELDGRKIWRLASRVYGGTQQSSRVEVEADSFKPIHCWWKVGILGEADVTYTPGVAELKLNGKDEVKKIDLTGAVYDNEEMVQLMRRLPLAPDYKTTVQVFTGLGGGNIIPLEVAVTAQEKVEVPAGTFDCYKVYLKIVKQTFWYSTDAHHYPVKFEAGGAIAELTSVTQRPAGAPVTYQDPRYQFSLSAPAEWMFFRPDNRGDKDMVKVIVLDSDAIATTVVTMGPRKAPAAGAQPSLREWTEKELIEGEGMNTLKALKIRSDSWKDRTVAGQPAVSVVGDFEEGDEKKVGYAVVSFAGTNAVILTLLSPAKDFEAFQPKFEAIVDSFKVK